MNTNRLVLGILAHVDAGKTTLAEALLYRSGMIRKAGRVDHKDAFLDTYSLEKERGITIFSKQARLSMGEKQVTLMDTPGHVDFSAEMERTLSCLDYAILVINGSEGIQGHVLTLWRLLKAYEVPVFLFVNKMDMARIDRQTLVQMLQKRLDSAILPFPSSGSLSEAGEDFLEMLALCDDALMERYLETGIVTEEDARQLIRGRKVFPCFFGSALKMEGVDEFLDALDRWCECPDYPEAFGARVIKITRDPQGNRLTHMKVTGGTLKVKQVLGDPRTGWEEKADQLRLYSGDGFQPVQEAPSGSIIAVTGLTESFAGEGIGAAESAFAPVLAPVLTYRLKLPEGTDTHGMYEKMRELEEEEPELHIVWQPESGEIHAQVMGDVQIEILQRLIQERFGTEVSFGEGSIVYKETIKAPAEGVGHYEPLRHYAEVHLLLEPGERGSGIVTETICSTDELEHNWQNLILTHLKEKDHRGVLTGSGITDIRITLLTGRAHLKHTEGGDFRQATYRAVRQGLMSTESLLLEPVYDFVLELPAENVGRALTDLTRMHASFSSPEQENNTALIRGSCPVSEMRGYQKEVMAYTRGEGQLFVSLKGYEPCHNAEEVQERIGYDPERDTENPSGSVFCSHGAGFTVPWNEVPSYMHQDSNWKEVLELLRMQRRAREIGISSARQMKQAAASGSLGDFSRNDTETPDNSGTQKQEEKRGGAGNPAAGAGAASGSRKREGGSVLTALSADKELEAIFTRTYGPVQHAKSAFEATSAVNARDRERAQREAAAEYLLVDGYNIIYDWEELRSLAATDIAAARLALTEILSNYQGYCGKTLILVFDAYKIENYPGEVQKYHNIYVVYTKEAETADQYIMKTVIHLEKNRRVTVATSDGIEQLIIMGQGALRMSAAGLKEEVLAANREMKREYLDVTHRTGTYLFQCLPDHLAEELEKIRLGEAGKRKKGEKTT